MMGVSGRNIAAGTVMIALFSACSNDDENSTDNNSGGNSSSSAENTPVEENNSNAEAEEEIFTAPLTGLEAEEEELNHRAVGVMIENSISARPQTSLHEADIVYEVLSEGNITRLLAVFHSEKPEEIGPVRSARPYYINLNNGYGAVYAAAGGSPDAYDMIENGEVDYVSGLEYEGVHFYRSDERQAPHNMYTSFDRLAEAAEELGYEWENIPPEDLSFSEEEAEGLEADTVNISYGSSSNNVQYNYEEDLQGYVRSVGGEQINDLQTNEPVSPRNLLVVEAEHQVTDDSGRRFIDIEAGGGAYLLQDGSARELSWENQEGRLVPVENGEIVPFQPGKTWINIVEDMEEDVSLN
ncbi:DUF3048 domain-containing protein [Alkalicoccus halolimnae]|uniref:DUF3048 domain-containing protein n=1 Tax=Alkalicoccus halolimnae TaxID=1667239 RepID=A0A5C7F5U7_9BACI|nr:DUF3048 domain-containing protein [Alkalicoccus halolimnae]TXF86032.1 DUF3048 domain-containing protein [Alkalicoccus halolimnae]